MKERFSEWGIPLNDLGVPVPVPSRQVVNWLAYVQDARPWSQIADDQNAAPVARVFACEVLAYLDRVTSTQCQHCGRAA